LKIIHTYKKAVSLLNSNANLYITCNVDKIVIYATCIHRDETIYLLLLRTRLSKSDPYESSDTFVVFLQYLNTRYLYDFIFLHHIKMQFILL